MFSFKENVTNLPPYEGAIAEVLKPAENIEGVKPIVAEKIYEIIKNKNRRYFGSSGASLTQQAYNPDLRQEGLDPKMAEIGLQENGTPLSFCAIGLKISRRRAD